VWVKKKFRMPVTVELKYEIFTRTWPGRIKIIELALAMLCMMCAAPAFHSTQHWFLLVVALCFLGTGFFTLYYMCLDNYLKNSTINWLQTEFWFTCLATFLYFTAFIAMLVDFSGISDPKYQYWYDAMVAAGVFAMFNDIVYAVGAYFLYVEWKTNPTGAGTASPVPPPI